MKITIKHSQTEMDLVFHCRFMSLAFSACRHRSHHYFFYFLLSLHMYIRTRHVSLNFLSCCFLISGKPTACFFNSLLIPEDHTKKLRDVMARGGRMGLGPPLLFLGGLAPTFNTISIGSFVKLNCSMKKYCGILAVFCQYYLQYIISNLTGFIIVWQNTPRTFCHRAMACLPRWCC